MAKAHHTASADRVFSQPDNSLQQLMNSERQSGLPLIDIN